MTPFQPRAHPSYSVAWLLAVLLGLLFLRRPDAFLCPQFWAEDFGFLIAAEQHGVASLGMPQAGYLHSLPRLIALAATLLDPILQPTFYLVAALAVTMGVGGSLFSPRLELPNQLLLAAAAVVVPHTGEVFFNPTNLQWIVALGILGTALKRDPRTLSDWCVDLGFLVVGGLTGPMILFAWPILLVRVAQRRGRAAWIFFLLSTAIAATQILFIAGLARESTAPFARIDFGVNVAHHLFGKSFLGVLATPPLPKIVSMIVGALIVALIGMIIVTSSRYRPALLSLLAFSILVLTAAAFQKRLDLWEYGDVAHGDRYFYISRVILLWILVVGAAASSRREVRYVAMAFLALSLASNAPFFRLVPHPDLGWYAACPRIRAGEAVILTINPDWKFYYQRGTPDSRILSRRETDNLESK
jgi:hypothetical protein